MERDRGEETGVERGDRIGRKENGGERGRKRLSERKGRGWEKQQDSVEWENRKQMYIRMQSNPQTQWIMAFVTYIVHSQEKISHFVSKHTLPPTIKVILYVPEHIGYPRCHLLFQQSLQL